MGKPDPTPETHLGAPLDDTLLKIGNNTLVLLEPVHSNTIVIMNIKVFIPCIHERGPDREGIIVLACVT